MGTEVSRRIRERVAKGALRRPAEPERGERDPELARREHAGKISGGKERETGERVAGPDHRLEPGAPGAHEGELHRHEEAVEDQQDDDDCDAFEHEAKLRRLFGASPARPPGCGARARRRS